MRFQAALFVMTAFCFMPEVSHADEFGPRFYAQAPKALGDYTAPPTMVESIAMEQNAAEKMQAIIPAAGEEQIESNVVVQPVKSLKDK